VVLWPERKKGPLSGRKPVPESGQGIIARVSGTSQAENEKRKKERKERKGGSVLFAA
jgi:hypothetical protein